MGAFEILVLVVIGNFIANFMWDMVKTFAEEGEMYDDIFDEMVETDDVQT